MKILYLGNFRDPGFEGLITVLNSLKVHFSKKHELYINDMSKLQDCDLVHIHSSGFYEALKYSRIKKPKIYSYHSNVKCSAFKVLHDYWGWFLHMYPGKEDRRPLLERFKMIFMSCISCATPIFVKRFALRKMNKVIVPNKWSSRILKKRNSVVINHGIDVNKFRKINVKKPTDKINIRYIGHTSTSKGLLEVTNVFKKLDPREFNKEIFITFIHKKIKNYFRRKDKTIKVHGLIKDIVKEYNKSDIIVLPYRHSLGAIATPLVLLEAMSCEQAIITTNLPHIKEICGDSVLYVDPYSKKQINEAINKFKDPKLRKELGRKARKRIVENHSMKEMMEAHEKLYQKVAR